MTPNGNPNIEWYSRAARPPGSTHAALTDFNGRLDRAALDLDAGRLFAQTRDLGQRSETFLARRVEQNLIDWFIFLDESTLVFCHRRCFVSDLCDDMMTTEAMFNAGASDADLVAASLAGNREAFGQIVARYQSLVCSLAYSGTGSLSWSEDLAQETFVAAWRQLGNLRQPARLRSWLCRIARNHICDELKEQKRDPSQTAEPLDALPEWPEAGLLPAQQVIGKEEEAILWHSIERMPDRYREPLVLYYREHKSVARVAADLDLTEDTVKQRLSRGRKLLHREVIAFVEGALAQTSPGKTFTLGVLAALPVLATTAKAAGISTTAAKASAVAKSASAVASVGAILGPILAFCGAWLGTRAGIENTSSPRERRFMVKTSRIVWAYILTFDLAMAVMIYLSSSGSPSHGAFWTIAFSTVCLAFIAGLLKLMVWTNRNQRRIRQEELQNAPRIRDARLGASMDCYEYRSKAQLLGLPLIHIVSGRRPDGKVAAAKGWVAVGRVAYGALLSFGGIAIGAVAFGGLGLGVLALAGLAIGFWAAGGAAAFGYLALSGACAIGWMGACGSAAIAYHYAVGSGYALAPYANNATAKAFVETHAFYLLAKPKVFSTVVGLCWLPVLLLIWQSFRRRKKLREGAANHESLHP